MFVSHNSVLLVVLLDFDANIVNKVSHFVQSKLLNWVIHDIVELDQHCCQVSLVGVGNHEGLLLCQLQNLLWTQAWFSYDWADSHVCVNQVNGCVSSWIEHFVKIKYVIRSSVLSQIIILDWSDTELFSSGFILFWFQGSVNLLLLLFFSFFLSCFVFFSAFQLGHGSFFGFVK